MISQLRGLTNHSICWWIHRHTAVDGFNSVRKLPFHPAPTFEIFPLLASFPVRLLLQMHACCTSPPSLPSKTVGFLHRQWVQNRSAGGLYTAKECRIGARGGAELLSLEQGFMTFNMICIIVCISCSMSTQCQHGWSVLISKLHHKDKRNTCQYKVILLPTARVKLFRRTRHSESCCMNRQIIASWFHKECQESHSYWSGEFIVRM